MAISIKFTKFDNTPWGFRLAGGSDFPQPLTVIRITEGSLAECMGLKVGDVIVRLNDQSISNLTHGQAHEELMHAGNNFVLGVQREEEARKAAEAISEENIVPYKIALADLPPVFPEQILKEETVIERSEEAKIIAEQAPLSAEDEIRQEETKEEKSVNADSEIVLNKNLTDDEIAQLILEEEELLSNKGLLGVNFKKLRPRAPILKGSKVLEELQHIATAEPERVQELKRTSTFLQKPQRPIPKPKYEQKTEEDDGETYKVVIKKQDRKTVIARLVEKGLLPAGSEASVTKTPEPSAPSEVKMHEMERRPEEEDFPVMSDSNPPCSTIPPDIDTAKLDPHETHLFEDQSIGRTTYKCKPKLSESTSIPQIRRRRSSFKGYYLEHVLQRNVNPVLECVKKTYLISPKVTDEKKDEPKSTRMKGRYVEKCLYRSVLRNRHLKFMLANFVDYAKSSLSNLFATSRLANGLSCRSRKELPVVGVVASNCTADNSVPSERKYDECVRDAKISEWHEDGSSCSLQRKSSVSFCDNSTLNEEKIDENDYDVLDYTDLIMTGEADERSISSKPMSETEEEDNLSKFLQLAEDYVSAEVFHRGSRRFSRPRKSIDVVSEEDDNALEKLLRSAEDYVFTEVFHRGSRRLSKSRKSIDIVSEEEDNRLEKFLRSAEDYVSSEVFHRGHRRFSKSRKSVDISPEKEDNILGKFLQTAEDYVSSEVFHRGHRRFSKSRKSVDILPEKEDNILGKFLQATENYVSSEVFHRGHRRFSKSRKSIDILPDKKDNILEKFLQAAEDYVSTEVFHRGHRRFSKARKSVDILPEKDDNILEKFLQATEDYVSAEVFHRGHRRFSKSRKSVDTLPEKDDNILGKFLQAAEDYVSAEVFHRGHRRFSKSRKSVDILPENDDFRKFLQSAEDYVSAEVFRRGSRRLSRATDAGLENVSNLLRSTGNYVSSEVFHRRSRRLSRSSRRESVSLAIPTWWNALKSMSLKLPWFSFKATEKNLEYSDIYEENIGKNDSEIEHDKRRLSFVPTILYQSVTNCIGVDFTRLVAYAFVPCTSIILLYMYN